MTAALAPIITGAVVAYLAGLAAGTVLYDLWASSWYVETEGTP
jgi:hypothetical protein